LGVKNADVLKNIGKPGKKPGWAKREDFLSALGEYGAPLVAAGALVASVALMLVRTR